MSSSSPTLLLPMLLIVASNLVYQIAQRTIPRDVDPALSVLLSYVVAIVATLAVWPFLRGNAESVPMAFKRLNLSTALVGVAIVGIEFGFLLAYRNGWRVSTAALTSGVSIALVLLPVGIVLFRESWSVQRTLGAGLCLGGLYLLHRP